LVIKRNSDSNYWDGTSWTKTLTTLTTTVSGTTWTRNYAMPAGASLPVGAYTLTATAFDKTNNSKAVSITATVDNAPPTVSVSTPVNNANYTSLSSSTGTVTDTGGSAVAGVTVALYRYATAAVATGYWAGSSTWTSTYGSGNERPATGTSNWSLSLPTLTNGQYNLRATARDKAGNITYSSNVIFWKTAGASTVSLSSAGATATSSSVQLTFSSALDSVIAQDLYRYGVTVNGMPVSVQSAIYSGTGKVTLSLAGGALSKGASVVVKWSNLMDSSGKVLSGQSSALNAQ
jgi:hypothetical protein